MLSRSLLAAFALLFVASGLAPGAQAQPTPLFLPEPVGAREALSGRAQAHLRFLEQKPTTASVRLVRLPERLVNQRALSLLYTPAGDVLPGTSAPGAARLLVRRERVTVPAEGRYVWSGRVYAASEPEAPLGDAFLHREAEGHVTGTLRVGPELFHVRPLEGGLHALVALDEAAIPRGGERDYGNPERFERPSPQEPALSRREGTLASASGAACDPCRISVLVLYTNNAAMSGGGGFNNGINYVGTAIEEANAAYANSGLDNLLLALATSSPIEVRFEESTDISRSLQI